MAFDHRSRRKPMGSQGLIVAQPKQIANRAEARRPAQREVFSRRIERPRRRAGKPGIRGPDITGLHQGSRRNIARPDRDIGVARLHGNGLREIAARSQQGFDEGRSTNFFQIVARVFRVRAPRADGRGAGHAEKNISPPSVATPAFSRIRLAKIFVRGPASRRWRCSAEYHEHRPAPK